VVKKRNFWKEAAAKANTPAKNVGVQICRNCFQDSPLDKAAREAIPAQLERADFLRKDIL